MIWLFLECIAVVYLYLVAYNHSSNITETIFFATLLIWFALRELIGVIEKRRK